MKKLLSIFLSLGFILLLSACSMTGGTVNGDKTGGDVISKTSEQTQTENNSSTTLGKLKTREEAIKIALDHAGFKKEEVMNLTAELDKDLSWSEWEVEFDKDNFEYSYEINAATGEIIKNEKEID